MFLFHLLQDGRKSCFVGALGFNILFNPFCLVNKWPTVMFYVFGHEAEIFWAQEDFYVYSHLIPESWRLMFQNLANAKNWLHFRALNVY